jgi:hypothetical protein
MVKYEWKKGDKLMVIDDKDQTVFKNGDIVIADNDVSSEKGSAMNTYIIFNEVQHGGFFNERFEKVNSPITNSNLENKNMEKKIIEVLAVDTKTGKIVKNVTVVAGNEQEAILKAFDVDAENTKIMTTEKGKFEETKPTTVVLAEKEKEAKK